MATIMDPIFKKKKSKDEGVSIADTIKSIKSKFGDDAIMRMDQKAEIGIDSISTGSFGLNLAIGIGGLPRGRITEIFGPESSGKTTMALHVVAEAQKKGGVCAYIDAEHAMDPVYATKIGVNTKDLFISQPNSGEQALEILDSIVRSGNFDVVVVDSVAALTPQAEIEGDMEQQFMGKQARMMGQAIRKITAVSAKSKTVIVFINQIRTLMNVMPGQSTETTPGGRALRFAASLRIDIRRIAQIKKGEEIMGGRVRAKVVKNKVAPPFKQTEFDLMYGEGISREGEILALGEQTGVLSKSGSSYTFGITVLGRGYDAARMFLKSTPDISATIYDAINAKLKE